MTMRSFGWTLAALGRGNFVALLLPMAVAMVTVAGWAEIGRALFGVASLACASCADPGNGIDTVGALGGLFGAGTAAGGAAAGTGETGGVGVGRDDRTVWYPTGPESFPDAQSRQNWYDQHFGPGPAPWQQTIINTHIRMSEQIQKWAQEWIDPERRWFFDEKGTAPASLS